MIQEIVDEKKQARIPISVAGSRGKITINALIDTGFSGSLSLPIELAVELGLELTGRIFIELADGSIKKELIFKGKLELDEEEKETEILLNESEETLIGASLFSNKKLELDFIENKVSLN